MSNTYKVAAGIFALLVVAAIVVYFAFFRSAKPVDEAIELAPTPTPAVVPTPTPTLAERLSARLQGITLRTSDAVVRELVGELSQHPKLAAWLANDDLVRRFTAAVDNIADGSSPRQHLDFLRPSSPFRAISKRGRFFARDASFRRYDTAAAVVESIDAEGAVALYRELEPLIDEAYREISPPGREFDERLMQAIDHLLAAPVPRGQIELEERTVATYEFADEDFAALSDAQKQLIRMGPDNMARVQAKLREIRDALAAVPAEE